MDSGTKIWLSLERIEREAAVQAAAATDDPESLYENGRLRWQPVAQEGEF